MWKDVWPPHVTYEYMSHLKWLVPSFPTQAWAQSHIVHVRCGGQTGNGIAIWVSFPNNHFTTSQHFNSSPKGKVITKIFVLQELFFKCYAESVNLLAYWFPCFLTRHWTECTFVSKTATHGEGGNNKSDKLKICNLLPQELCANWTYSILWN
jgi:hypothetical protein